VAQTTVTAQATVGTTTGSTAGTTTAPTTQQVPRNFSTDLAKASLAKQGITNPTKAQLDAERKSINAQRADGKGWGVIAQSLGLNLARWSVTPTVRGATPARPRAIALTRATKTARAKRAASTARRRTRPPAPPSTAQNPPVAAPAASRAVTTVEAATAVAMEVVGAEARVANKPLHS